MSRSQTPSICDLDLDLEVTTRINQNPVYFSTNIMELGKKKKRVSDDGRLTYFHLIIIIYS